MEGIKRRGKNLKQIERSEGKLGRYDAVLVDEMSWGEVFFVVGSSSSSTGTAN
jgi:hypothetical protein